MHKTHEQTTTKADLIRTFRADFQTGFITTAARSGGYNARINLTGLLKMIGYPQKNSSVGKIHRKSTTLVLRSGIKNNDEIPSIR